jgi:Zn-dependent protease with chaperone function
LWHDPIPGRSNVLNAMTDEARATLRGAHQAALELGRADIDGVAMVLAMLADPTGVAARALARFSFSAKEFVARACPDISPGQVVTQRHTPLAADVRAALASAAHDVLSAGQAQITSGHILLGLVAQDGPATRALAELGARPELIQAAVADTAGPPVTLAHLVATLPLPAPRGLPSRWSRLASAGSLVLAYLAAAGLALLTVPGYDRVFAAVGYLAVVVVDGLIQLGLTGLTARRVERRLAKRAPAVIAAPPVVAEVLRDAGVRQFELRVSTGRPLPDRAYRLGRRACIVLSPMTIVESRSLPFVLLHEVGHVVRRDSGRHRISFIMAAGLIVIPLISPGILPLGVALLAGGAVFVADRWRAEYACDAIAARWVGVEPLQTWMRTHAQGLSRPENRTPARWVRRALGRLTHPPITRRAARAAKLAAS